MAEDEEFEDLEEPDDPDVVDLEGLEDDDDILDEEALDDDIGEDLEVDGEEGDDGNTVGTPAAAAAATAVADEDEEEEEDDDVIDPDDVEAGLDVILKDRLVAVEDEEDDEDEVPEVDERGEASIKVLAKRPGEFVCESCFLLKHPSQLADPARTLCRDCV